MVACVIERTESSVTIQIQVSLSRSMLETEEGIQQALNEAGVLATTEALKQFDTDGSPIEFGSTRWTSKGQEPKIYQTPYGEASVERHVYQTSSGGATFCPLEREARIIITSTPRFAQQVSFKYAEGAGGRAVADLAQNHGRHVTLCLVQDLAAAVGSVALAKEEQWHYATPKLQSPIATIGIGLDGTCILMCEDGQRQTMVGTISLYDAKGERQHTIYLAATPEYGKATFHQRLSREIEHVRRLYPRAKLTGIADGAEDNWSYLEQYTKDNCIDFHHVTDYLGGAARAVSPRSFSDRQEWLERRCHDLKHKEGAAQEILTELKGLSRQGLNEMAQEGLDKAISYFTNHKHRMNYAQRRAEHKPIGSGVTEGACKTIVKMRLCKGGAKWKEEGAAIVLSLRTLLYTQERWQQFWSKVDRYGFPIAA
jgi:hypothetical protein